MNTQTFSDWVQVITSVAVLMGMVLVVLELRQSREIAEAQIHSDAFANGAATAAVVMGEQAADVMARACSAPATLTPADLIVLEFYLRSRVAMIRRMISIAGVSGLYSEQDWRAYARSNVLPEVFATTPGRVWWSLNTPAGELGELGDALLAQARAVDCAARLRAYGDGVGISG